MRRKPPYRDGKVYVCAQMCDTCIFRPGNLMDLEAGRVAQMVAEATRAETAITCHETLDGHQAVCRGFFDHHATAPLQIAERLGALEYQPVSAGAPREAKPTGATPIRGKGGSK